jgi:peptide deformylase
VRERDFISYKIKVYLQQIHQSRIAIQSSVRKKKMVYFIYNPSIFATNSLVKEEKKGCVSEIKQQN